MLGEKNVATVNWGPTMPMNLKAICGPGGLKRIAPSVRDLGKTILLDALKRHSENLSHRNNLLKLSDGSIPTLITRLSGPGIIYELVSFYTNTDGVSTDGTTT
ncbi:hypothetical protein LCGC14_1279030 [marine sediment metagenome]|uniref:Uncharacterized protein n=1 Tax=marine sediment metagenome TaxID=412755 RepID=A0A0F9KVQ1_9ZZZZ